MELLSEDVLNANRVLPSLAPLDRTPELISHPSVLTQEELILNLVPCTWDEFLAADSSWRWDYVDGLVVYSPTILNVDHSGLVREHATVLECNNSTHRVYQSPIFQVSSVRGGKKWTDDNKDPAQQVDGQVTFGLRYPDFTIVKTRPGSTGSSSTSRDPEIVRCIDLPHPYSSKLLMVAETTWRSTRQVDLYTKWASYAQSGVPLYVILDRGTKTIPRQIIVGSLDRFSNATSSWHGDPKKPIRDRPENAPTYYKKVYKPTDIVDCPVYEHLHMTAADLLDLETMRTLATKMRDDRSKQRERADDAEKEADQYRKEADQYRKEAGQYKKEGDEYKKREEHAEQELKLSRLQMGKKPKEDHHKERKASTTHSSNSQTKPPKHDKKTKEDKHTRGKTPAGSSAGSSTGSPTKSPKHKKSRKDN